MNQEDAASQLYDDIMALQVPCVGGLPVLATAGSAGADLKTTEAFVIWPGKRVLVGTGIRLALPVGYVGLVCPKSGLAVKHGITVLNGPGIIDSDYRGEIKVPLVCFGQKHAFSVGDKVAQLLIVAVPRVMFIECETLDTTVRGEGGFGSTGK